MDREGVGVVISVGIFVKIFLPVTISRKKGQKIYWTKNWTKNLQLGLLVILFLHSQSVSFSLFSECNDINSILIGRTIL